MKQLAAPRALSTAPKRPHLLTESTPTRSPSMYIRMVPWRYVTVAKILQQQPTRGGERMHKRKPKR